MAPEQGSDPHAADIRADLYSLGCTLYKLLTGQAPFSFSGYTSPLRKLQAHAHEPVPPVQDLRPEVPQALVSVLARLLAKDPRQRLRTPEELATALARFVGTANLP